MKKGLLLFFVFSLLLTSCGQAPVENENQAKQESTVESTEPSNTSSGTEEGGQTTEDKEKQKAESKDTAHLELVEDGLVQHYYLFLSNTMCGK